MNNLAPLQEFKDNITEIDNNISSINLPQVFDYIAEEQCTELSYSFDNNKYTEVICKVYFAHHNAGFPYGFMFYGGNYYSALGSYTSTALSNGLYHGTYILHYQLKSNNKLKITVTSSMQMSWKEDWGMMGIPSYTERTFEIDLAYGFNKVGMKFVGSDISNQAPPFHITVWAK